MSTATRTLGSLSRYIVIGVVVTLVTALLLFRPTSGTRITAYFTSSTGLYVGDQVRVLGVKVGTVTSIEPQADRVKVEMRIDGEPVPESVRAAIVSPSLVSGRFIQLAPAYVKGPQLADGGVIDVEDTTIPVSFDQVKKELTELSTALGPNGPTSSRGALADVITTLDANLDGSAATDLRSSLTSMRRAADSLSSSRGDLFGTVASLDSFTKSLVRNDSDVRGFTTALASVSEVLDTNRTQLTATIAGLDSALRQVSEFTEDNRSTIDTSLTSVNELAGTLADKSNTLASLLHIAPHSLTGLYNLIEDQALTGRVALGNLDSVSELVCGAVLGAGGTAGQCAEAIGPLLDLLGLSAVPGSAADKAAKAAKAGANR